MGRWPGLWPAMAPYCSELWLKHGACTNQWEVVRWHAPQSRWHAPHGPLTLHTYEQLGLLWNNERTTNKQSSSVPDLESTTGPVTIEKRQKWCSAKKLDLPDKTEYKCENEDCDFKASNPWLLKRHKSPPGIIHIRGNLPLHLCLHSLLSFLVNLLSNWMDRSVILTDLVSHLLVASCRPLGLLLGLNNVSFCVKQLLSCFAYFLRKFWYFLKQCLLSFFSFWDDSF